MQKIYSAFISSAFESLRNVRNEVIDGLLDNYFFPVCMEHFTVTANGNFDEIKEHIYNSDIFVLIMGNEYGSCDENGKSWTEREYEYAQELNKPTLVLVCEELQKLRELQKIKDKTDFTESEKNQLAFLGKIKYARDIRKDFSTQRLLSQFLNGLHYDELTGWVRVNREIAPDELDKWRKDHCSLDLAGTWYHAHLSPHDPNYIRIGTINITQNFTPAEYLKFKIIAYNYDVIFDNQDGINRFGENTMKRTRWEGEYTIDDMGQAVGLFSARRESEGTFGEYDIDIGIRHGVHYFSLNTADKVKPSFFTGEFHDEAPSPKHGSIYVFRTPEERQRYLEENFIARQKHDEVKSKKFFKKVFRGN